MITVEFHPRPELRVEELLYSKTCLNELDNPALAGMGVVTLDNGPCLGTVAIHGQTPESLERLATRFNQIAQDWRMQLDQSFADRPALPQATTSDPDVQVCTKCRRVVFPWERCADHPDAATVREPVM